MNDDSFADRPAPRDVAAEEAVISACMLASVAPGRATYLRDIAIGALTPERFCVEANRQTFAAIVALHERGVHVDAVTVGAELDARGRLAQVGGRPRLGQLLLVAETLDDKAIAAHVRRVSETASLRDVLLLIEQARARLYTGVSEPGAFLEDLESRLFDATRAQLAGSDAEHVSAALSRDYASLRAPKALAYRTGFPRLDWILGGGLRPKALSIFGGLTSAGKTALAMNVATTIASQAGVLVVSLEMTSDELVQRAVCGMSGVPIENVRERRLSPSEHARYLQAQITFGKLPLYIADEPGLALATIRAKGRRLASKLSREGSRLGLIVVDYLQLVKPLPGPKNETREQQVAALSRNLKGLAKDLDVHVLALAQLNAGHEVRRGDEKRPRLGDLRESKAIANDADVVAFVHREDYQAERDDRGDSAPMRGLAEVIVAKHRGGRTGVAPLIFDRGRCRFENPPENLDARIPGTKEVAYAQA